MAKQYIEDQLFDKKDFANEQLEKGEYDHCKFLHCNFNEANLIDIVFANCEFIGCDLSMANITKTGFREVKFIDSKLMGLRFENCNPFLFSVAFENCILNHSSFYGIKIFVTQFVHSQLIEVDFTECSLAGSVFSQCDLSGAIFDHTNLEKVDFRTATNFTINPSLNVLKKAKFSMPSVVGLLKSFDIIIEN